MLGGPGSGAQGVASWVELGLLTAGLVPPSPRVMAEGDFVISGTSSGFPFVSLGGHAPCKMENNCAPNKNARIWASGVLGAQSEGDGLGAWDSLSSEKPVFRQKSGGFLSALQAHREPTPGQVTYGRINRSALSCC